ncbi:hypothetical protein FNF29_03833 [Cafeteria roenbergensis]|uniref:Glutaredoxin domain-containing protein n=2 Tax=Cafeteria roenbergensis TaxID=33653 RepID=A0A5A8CHY5_CAFRO|nr:hypothetical protein FNF29_03833 [Cafeteria roenbergensis]KAA0161713.1 hypothetical protein FNF31_03656 [Cafeteria roenbergensis]|eukprot:KAA0152606.1 hypothetical protein FNF29_03833 [Cafeteria roenbergensis]
MGNEMAAGSSSSKAFVEKEIADNKVVVFSKVYCPFCVKAKRVLDAFKSSGLDYKVIELDQRRDGSQIQSALAAVTGQRTVPNVFVNGKSIGGGDETAYLHSSGKLRELLVECGAISA